MDVGGVAWVTLEVLLVVMLEGLPEVMLEVLPVRMSEAFSW